jgi:hypothetical protein
MTFRILNRWRKGWVGLFSQESEIMRKLRLMEELKAELVINVGKFLLAVARNSEQAIIATLSAVVIHCYVLGRRLGIDYSALEEVILSHLGDNIKREEEVEKWFGDYSELRRHLRQKRCIDESNKG